MKSSKFRKTKEQKAGFLGMLLGTLGTSLLGNLLTGKWTIATNQGQSVTRASEGAFRAGESNIRADQNFWCCFIF